VNEKTAIPVLYKKLLSLYPRRFRERLGESMEQTFQDLYRERREGRQRLFGFVLWTFLETLGGIIEEYVLQIRQGDIMQALLTTLRIPAIVSFILVLPFMIMEVINRRNFNEGFPIPLFVIMWLLPILFILTGMPIVRNINGGNSLLANSILLVVRVTFLAFLAWMWVGILIDQMPCFLGVPNCD
jgi:hypothetical protein